MRGVSWAGKCKDTMAWYGIIIMASQHLQHTKKKVRQDTTARPPTAYHERHCVQCHDRCQTPGSPFVPTQIPSRDVPQWHHPQLDDDDQLTHADGGRLLPLSVSFDPTTHAATFYFWQFSYPFDYRSYVYLQTATGTCAPLQKTMHRIPHGLCRKPSGWLQYRRDSYPST